MAIASRAIENVKPIHAHLRNAGICIQNNTAIHAAIISIEMLFDHTKSTSSPRAQSSLTNGLGCLIGGYDRTLSHPIKKRNAMRNIKARIDYPPSRHLQFHAALYYYPNRKP